MLQLFFSAFQGCGGVSSFQAGTFDVLCFIESLIASALAVFALA